MELKSRKSVLCLIVVWLLGLRVCGQLDVTGVEMRGVFGDLRVSHFLQSGEEEGQCGWCAVSSFASVPLSGSWSSGWVFFVFNREGHELAENYFYLFIYLLFIFYLFISYLFIFWWGRGQISSTFRYFTFRWSYAQKPLFSILKKVSAPITSGECSRDC